MWNEINSLLLVAFASFHTDTHVNNIDTAGYDDDDDLYGDVLVLRVALDLEKSAKLSYSSNGSVQIDISQISLHSSSSKVSDESVASRKGLCSHMVHFDIHFPGKPDSASCCL